MTIRTYNEQKAYFERCGIISCDDCGRERLQYGRQGICRVCYEYRRMHNGQPRTQPVRAYGTAPWIHCWACFDYFKPQDFTRTHCCSIACARIVRHLRSFRGHLHPCQGCGRTRFIRAKCLCASCYVLARLALNQAGVYGQCSSRLNRFAKVPGVLRT